MHRPPQHFSFFLVPGFSLVALSCAIDALRAANVEADQPQFAWKLLSEDGLPVHSSSGVPLPCMSYEDLHKTDAIAVCGGERSHLFSNDHIVGWLKRQARTETLIGSISDGAYVVARAGLFDAVRSTIHWKCQSAYRELFPKLDVRTSIFELDRNRFSCAGGTASLDLMLRFISLSMDEQTAGRIADNYFHDVIRSDDQTQHITSALRFATRNKTLSEALLLMEEALENPVSIAGLAERLGISHRQLDRLFRHYLGTSPSSHYREMRLLRASGLLKQTGLSVGEIALCSGFQSASHLAKYFKTRFGQTPLQHRKTR